MDNQILLDTREVAEKIFLGKKSVQAIQRAVRLRQIPFIRVGNRVYFVESELRSWLVNQMSQSVSTTLEPADNTATIRRL